MDRVLWFGTVGGVYLGHVVIVRGDCAMLSGPDARWVRLSALLRVIGEPTGIANIGPSWPDISPSRGESCVASVRRVLSAHGMRAPWWAVTPRLIFGWVKDHEHELSSMDGVIGIEAAGTVGRD